MSSGYNNMYGEQGGEGVKSRRLLHVNIACSTILCRVGHDKVNPQGVGAKGFTDATGV